MLDARRWSTITASRKIAPPEKIMRVPAVHGG